MAIFAKGRLWPQSYPEQKDTEIISNYGSSLWESLKIIVQLLLKGELSVMNMSKKCHSFFKKKQKTL